MLELLEFIFTIESQAGLFIIWTIFLLFFAGLGVFLRYLLIKLPFEKRQLGIAVDYFKSDPSLDDLDRLTEELRDRLTEELRDRGLKERSTVYNRIEQIIEIKDNQGQIDQDALSDILVGRESVKAGGARYVLSVLIILGLIGTLWGLSNAITQVSPLITEQLDDLKQIGRVMRGTLDGMSTAFATTLAGLLTSLFLGGFSWLFNRRQTLFLAELEDFTTTTLLPCLSPPVGLDAIQNATETLSESTETLKFTSGESVKALEKAIQQLTDASWEARLEQQYTLAEKFEETTENLLASLEGISSFQFTVQEAVRTFKESTEQSMQQITSTQEELRETLNKTLPDLSSESKSLKDAITEYQNSQTEFIKDLNRTITGGNDGLLRRITALIAEYQNSLTDFTDNLKDAISKSNDALIENLAGIMQNAGMFKDASDGLSGEQNSVLQLLNDNLSGLNAVTEELRGLRSDLRGQGSDGLSLDISKAPGRRGRRFSASDAGITEIADRGSGEREILSQILLALQELNESVKSRPIRRSFLRRLFRQRVEDED